MDRSRDAVPEQTLVEIADSQVHVAVAAGDPASAIPLGEPPGEEGEAASVAGAHTA